MQKIEFTDEELALLRELVQHELGEIEVEILRTATRDFREMLKRRRDTIDHMLSRLAAVPQPA